MSFSSIKIKSFNIYYLRKLYKTLFWDFPHTFNLGKYLAFPILTSRVEKSDFNFILDRINSKLARWKRKLISRAGKVTLAQTVISSIPSYTMQNMLIPKGTQGAIDTKVIGFVQGSNATHWVHYGTVKKPKHKGGLGIRKARHQNISLLGKHAWALMNDPERLWVCMLSNKYLSNNNFFQVELKSGSSFTWRSILKAFKCLKERF